MILRITGFSCGTDLRCPSSVRTTAFVARKCAGFWQNGHVKGITASPVSGGSVTVSPCISSKRWLSDKSKDSLELVTTEIDSTNGVATLTMNNPPVNSLSLEMLQALSKSIQNAEQESSLQGLVLQSCSASVFSAGLDIREMHDPDPTRLNDFWTSFQKLYLDLYGSRLACIAAMEGHAPAAGCMLALSCDYRIMSSTESSSKPPTIGLNETKLGIAAPSWLAEQFIDTVGRRQAELGLSLGKLYTPEQALEIGLVDDIVAKDQVRSKAQEAVLEWVKIPPQARVASKMLVRKTQIDNLRANREKDTEYFTNFVRNEKVQRNLTAYLEMLAKKSKS